CQLDSNFGVLGIQIRDLAQHLKTGLRGSCLSMHIDHDEVVSSSFDYQVLLRVQFRQTRRDSDVVGLEPIDFPEHRDRLQGKILIAIVLSNPLKTRNRVGLIANASMKVPEDIQSGEVVWFTLDDLAVFFYGRRNLTHFQVFLGCAQSLYLIERHVLRSRGMNS